MSQLNANERRSVFHLFLYGFGNAGAYVIARTVADSEFLSRIGPDQLHRMYLAAAGVVAFVSAVYGRLAQRTSVRRSVTATLIILAVVSAALPELIHRFPSSTLAMACVYMLAQIRGTLGTIQFTMLINEQFANRRPERVVGIVGIGSTLAGFIGGMALSQFTDVVDVATLMYVVAAIDILTLLPVRELKRTTPAIPSEHSSPPLAELSWLAHTEESGEQVRVDHRSSRYVFLLAAMVAVCVFASTLVEYQWKVTVATDAHRNEQDLARYFGRFYGWTYLLTGALQFFVTANLLKRRGLLAGLLVFPMALLVTSGAVLLASTGKVLLWTMTLAKGSDAFKRSLNDPSVHILYSRMDRESRHRAVTLIAGIVKPLTEALAAIVLVILVPVVATQSLSAVVVLLVAIWLVLNLLVWRNFRQMDLQDS